MERVYYPTYHRDEGSGLEAWGPALEPEDGSTSNLQCDQGIEPPCAPEGRGQAVSTLRN